MSYTIWHAYNFFIRGFNVLAFDWRGFGESSDWPTDQEQLCYTEFLLDYDAAINYIKTRPEVDSLNIGVFGYSTSAYLSFAIAARRSDIRAFAGRGLISSFADVIPILNKAFPDRPPRQRPAGYPVSLEPIHAAATLSCPVFLIVGENDERTPPWMSQLVMTKIQTPHELWIVPDAEHGGLAGPEYKDYPEFFVRVSSFYHRCLGM
jgi:pimeloyl-ACP methyl ester carboxylesterase